MIFLIGSIGGHLSELQQLGKHISDLKEIKYVTFYRQNRAKDANYLYIIDPEQNIIRYIINAIQSFLLMAKYRPKLIISAGAGVAVPMMTLGKMIGIKVIHFEISCQINTNSKTGKYSKQIGIPCYVQNLSLLDHKTKYIGNPFEKYKKQTDVRTSTNRKIFVTIGNTKHDFKRINLLLDTLKIIYPETPIIVQGGYTSIESGKNIKSIPFMSPQEFEKKIKECDLIISHAGSGTIREVLDGGKVPLILPRLIKLHEHSDPSQIALADYVEKTNLAEVIKDPSNVKEVKGKCDKALKTKIEIEKSIPDPMEFLAQVIIKEYISYA